MSRYQKAHPWGIVVIFLYFCGLLLESKTVIADGKEERKNERKNKLDIFVAELLDCTKG